MENSRAGALFRFRPVSPRKKISFREFVEILTQEAKQGKGGKYASNFSNS